MLSKRTTASDRKSDRVFRTSLLPVVHDFVYSINVTFQWCDEGYSWYEPQAICVSSFSLKSMRLLGIGETIRGLAIDLADLGKGPGKTIAADGKAETKEGRRQIEDSLHR